MDLLDSVMELLNSTPSPPINVVNHQLSNSGESHLLENSAEMEPNNLSQTAARVVATVTAAAGETIAAAQTFSERNLELKLPILSSSSSDSESEEPANATAGTSAVVEGERAASPPPNCAICLGRCKNKCFTDSCMHQFCFKCLCEWSKVKPECPLCKQTFKSIIHNVKSIDQFEEYHVQPPTVQIAHPPFEMDFQDMRIFGVVHPGHNRNHAWNESTHRPFFYGDFSATSPYSSASTGGGSLSTASGSSSNRSIALSGNGSGLRNQYVYRGELLDLYRQEYPGAIANSGTLSQLWRRYVYDRKLYAMPVADITGRFRESSARFYRDNPSQIHRLMPWINRDIVCLLRLTQHDVTTVLESINSSLTLMNILSPAFRRRLQPFLGTKTAHFIHELNNFARSPYDMIGYDRAVQYSPQSNNEEIVIEFTTSDESSDNEQIDVAGDEGGNNNTISSTSRSRSTNASSINAINLTIHNRLTSAVNAGGSRGGGLNGGNNGSGLSDIQDDVSLVIDLRGESDNNETTSTAQATTNSSNYQNGQNAGTSEGDIIMSGTQPAVSENIELTSGSSDECEFILERKPPHLRTPEMVSLDSASDSDVVFVEESKALNKTSFSSSEGEQNDGPSDHKHHSRHHNKIAALVESKKRNHSGNLVKSEQQDSQIEVYNLGASTSAALRLSLQKRVDTSHRSDNGASSSRVRRDKYSLRNSDSQSRAERQAPKRRGKCLDSESSHSSTSSSTTISSSSSSTTSSSNSSSSSSDEEYVASTSQRRKTTSAGGAEGATTRKSGHKVKKTKKRKVSNSNNRRTNKHDSRRRKKTNNDYSSDDDDDNGHMGKNFALVMAINERQKRQNQKSRAQKSRAQENDDEEASEGENSWRLKAVIEPLRKQQQQRAKSSHKSNERKRQRKTPTQQQQQQQQHVEIDTEHKSYEKRQKFENQTQQESESQYVRNFFKADDTSSDESDNINLVQLKTKLIGQDRHKEQTMEDTNTNQEQETTVETTAHAETEMATKNWNNSESGINGTATDTNTNTPTVTTISTTSSDHSNIPTTSNTYSSYVMTYSPPTMQSADATTHPVATASETTTNNIVESTTTQNDLLNFTDDSNDNDQNERIDGHDHVDDHDSNSTSYHNDQQQLPSSSMDNYHDNTHADDNNEDDLCDDDENLSNMPTNKTLNESNVFADGTSMSTTTTDTILHDAAEQISSAAVNFYNPQQTFNTADFADENSTNSSSSDSSMSSSTTSLSSSSNSSSSNTNSYINYEHS